MRRFIIPCILLFLSLQANGQKQGQQQDTLRNIPPDTTLTAFTYNTGWGYYTGHNNLYREEFAEKYYLDSTAKVVGVISYHTGTNTNKNVAEFNVYEVGQNQLPGTELASQEVPYANLNLDGSPTVTLFDEPVAVADSFFVAFNLNDYAHGGYEGDTIALLAAPDGTRTGEDLAIFGRNAIRYHNHSTQLWRDFYTQNFTPVATHFAIFPIITYETGTVTGLDEDGFGQKEHLTVYAPSPNPTTASLLKIPFELRKPAQVRVQLLRADGLLVREMELFSLSSGVQMAELDLTGLASGLYIYVVQSGTAALAGRVVIR